MASRAKTGYVYAMNAKKVIPPPKENAASAAGKVEQVFLPQATMTMRHRFVEYAIGISFWDEVKEDHESYVLPIRPDTVPGRIGQQSSCFTLHMHLAKPVRNPTLITIRVDRKSKSSILAELHRVNINQFTTYYDLDHLSKEIKRGWGFRTTAG
jgi:hypothetical protein